MSFYFLSNAVKNPPIGTAYAVWTGIGAIGTSLVGIILVHEAITVVRLFFLGLILPEFLA